VSSGKKGGGKGNEFHVVRENFGMGVCGGGGPFIFGVVVEAKIRGMGGDTEGGE